MDGVQFSTMVPSQSPVVMSLNGGGLGYVMGRAARLCECYSEKMAN